MNDLAKVIWDDAQAINRANAELAQRIEQGPRVVYCLWHGDALLAICGTQKRAEQEREMYSAVDGFGRETPIAIEPRVMYS